MKLNTAFAALFALHRPLGATAIVASKHGKSLVPRGENLFPCAVYTKPVKLNGVPSVPPLYFNQNEGGNWDAHYWGKNLLGQDKNLVTWKVVEDVTPEDPRGLAILVQSDIVQQENAEQKRLENYFQLSKRSPDVIEIPWIKLISDSTQVCKHHLKETDRKEGWRANDFLDPLTIWINVTEGVVPRPPS